MAVRDTVAMFRVNRYMITNFNGWWINGHILQNFEGDGINKPNIEYGGLVLYNRIQSLYTAIQAWPKGCTNGFLW